MRTAQFTGAKEVARTERKEPGRRRRQTREGENERRRIGRMWRERERERGEKLGGAVERGSSCDVE
jgi:hypothetical protein